MVRLTIWIWACLVVLPLYAQAPSERPRLPKGEASVLFNFSYAINEYYSREGRLPRSLNEIRDITDLTMGVNDGPELKPFTQRYMLMKEPFDIPHLGHLALVSVDTYFSTEFSDADSEVRSYVTLRTPLTEASSGVIPRSMIDPYLEKAGLVLEPLGGSIPAPTSNKRSSEPVRTEYEKRVAEALARGEIPIPPRSDKESWRDQKPLNPTPESSPAPKPAPAQPIGQSPVSAYLIVSILLLAGAIMFVVFKRKNKS
jgi:hypothetical protein